MSRAILQLAAALAVLLAVLAALPPARAEIACSTFKRGFCKTSCRFRQVEEACCRCHGDCCPTDDGFPGEPADDGSLEEPTDEGATEGPTDEGAPEEPTDKGAPEGTTEEGAPEEPTDEGAPEKLAIEPKAGFLPHKYAATVPPPPTRAASSSAGQTCVEADYPGQVRADGTIWYSLSRSCLLFHCSKGAIQVILDKCSPSAATPAPPPPTTTTTTPAPAPTAHGPLPCEDEQTGQLYAHGQEWFSVSVACVKFRCMNGSAHIAGIGCSASTTTARPALGPLARPSSVTTAPPRAIARPNVSPTAADRSCVDDFNQVHASGSVWTVPFRPCLRYRCNSGAVYTTTTACPAPPAGCAVVPPTSDQCCANYHCPQVQADCTYAGRTHRSGDRFPDDPLHPCQQKQCDDGLVVSLSAPTACPEVSCTDPDWPVGACCRTCPEEPLFAGLEELKQLVLRLGQRLNLTPTRMSQLETSVSRLVVQLATVMQGPGSAVTANTLVTNMIEMLGLLGVPGSGAGLGSDADMELLLTQLRFRLSWLVDRLRASLTDNQVSNASIDISEFIEWLRAYDANNAANAAVILMNDLARLFSGLLEEPGCVDAAGTVHAVNVLYLDNPTAPQLCYVCANTSEGVSPLVVMNVTDCGSPPPPGCSARFVPNSCCPVIQCNTGEAPCRDENRVLHQHGTTYVDDLMRPCTTYNCTDGGVTIVDQITCMLMPPHCKPWVMPGRCCPKSDCSKVSCTYDGRERDHGTSWPRVPMRPCVILTCLDGQLASDDLTPFCPPAPAPHCQARQVNYQCCPAYDCVSVNCTYGGKVYVEGETWSNDPQYPCKRYRCTRQGTEKIQDVTDHCAPQPHAGCQSRRVPGQCCKQWDCPECTFSGRSYPEDTVFWDNPSRRCVQSTCQNGQVVELARQAACPAVPAGCTPNYVGTGCCHVKYTCPFCMFDPQGRFMMVVDGAGSG